jgi:hypothetical protein
VQEHKAAIDEEMAGLSHDALLLDLEQTYQDELLQATQLEPPDALLDGSMTYSSPAGRVEDELIAQMEQAMNPNLVCCPLCEQNYLAVMHCPGWLVYSCQCGLKLEVNAQQAPSPAALTELLRRSVDAHQHHCFARPKFILHSTARLLLVCSACCWETVVVG